MTWIASADVFASTSPTLAMFFGGPPGFWEIMLVLAAMLLLFGKRLPEVGRSLGRGLVEFKKGIKGIEDEANAIDVEVVRDKNKQASENSNSNANANANQSRSLPAGSNQSEAESAPTGNPAAAQPAKEEVGKSV